MKNYEELLKKRYDFIFNNGDLGKLEQYCFVVKEEKFLRDLMEQKDKKENLGKFIYTLKEESKFKVKDGKEKEAEEFNKKFKEFKEQYVENNQEKFSEILTIDRSATKEIYDVLAQSINTVKRMDSNFYQDIPYDELENIYKFFRDIKKFGFADIDVNNPELGIQTYRTKRIKSEYGIVYKNVQEEFKQENGYYDIFEETKEQVEKSRIKIDRGQCSNIDSLNIFNFHKYIKDEYRSLKNEI